MGSAGFGAVARFALAAASVALVACSSHNGDNADAAHSGQGGAAGINAGGAGGSAGGAGGATGSGGTTDAGTPDSSSPDSGLPSSAACTPGITIAPGTSGDVSCNNDPTTLGVPNGAAVFAQTFALPTALTAGADNAFSFQLTGAGPFDFELWGSSTPCMAEELLWWGPFGAGTQCAQFRPSKAYANILFVYRQLYMSGYAFTTPSWTPCPGGTCPAGTTGTGKLTAAPLTAPVGNYELTRYEQVAGGRDLTLGLSGRLTVALGGANAAGQAPIAAGVFRLPATDPYGDAWYCIGDGSTLTEVKDKSGFLQNIQLSLRGITRLGDCGATPGSGSLAAAISLSSTSGTYFAADISGTIAAWAGTNLATTPYCSGAICDFRFRGSPQQHFVHVATTSTNLAIGTPAPVAVTAATWLVQASATQPFSLACSSEGSLNYQPNDNSSLQLAKVTGPLACPGTPISNDHVDITVDAR